jgi:hypothetical protein
VDAKAVAERADLIAANARHFMEALRLARGLEDFEETSAAAFINSRKRRKLSASGAALFLCR